MNRPSSSYPVVVNRKVVGFLMLFLGLAAAVLGLLVAGIEFWHSLENRHPIIWQNIAGAALFVGSGAALIQTGSVRQTLSLITEAIPLLASRRVNGDRSTDPQTDDPKDAP